MIFTGCDVIDNCYRVSDIIGHDCDVMEIAAAYISIVMIN